MRKSNRLFEEEMGIKQTKIPQKAAGALPAYSPWQSKRLRSLQQFGLRSNKRDNQKLPSELELPQDR